MGTKIAKNYFFQKILKNSDSPWPIQQEQTPHLEKKNSKFFSKFFSKFSKNGPPANKIVRIDIVRSCPLSSSVLFCPTLSPFVLFCPTRICPNLSDPKSTDIYRHYPILSSFVRTESVRICPIRILPISSDILICPINACFYPLLSSFVRKKPLNSLYPCPLPPAILHPLPYFKISNPSVSNGLSQCKDKLHYEEIYNEETFQAKVNDKI